MARIDSAYAYFLTTYGPTIGSRYESHKKSELRDTYNKIIKTNKESPLYKITQAENAGQYAIDIKEHANEIDLAISNLTGESDDITAILNKRIATSSDDSSISAKYVGEGDATADTFQMEVKSLATPQENLGRFLNPGGTDFLEGQHTFDVEVRGTTYEFQYNVNPGDTNQMIQEKLSRLFNNADIGLTADISVNNMGQTALTVRSKATGLPEGESTLFKISSNTNWRELNTLGIDRMTTPPANSKFLLNGSEHGSMSNTFTINKAFEVSLKQPSEEPVSIGLMADTEALSNGLQSLLDSYNGMLDIGYRYVSNANYSTLVTDVRGAISPIEDKLYDVGIAADESGFLALNKDTLSEKINSSEREDSFETLNKFKNSIKLLSTKTSINPMKYLDKIVVEYKNPNKTLAYPYASSQYSGMLVDYGL